MWYLYEYDDTTELCTDMQLLQNMTVEIVKNTLGIDDGDFDLPVAVGENDVPAHIVPTFAEYVLTPFDVKSGHSYVVSFAAD